MIKCYTSDQCTDSQYNWKFILGTFSILSLLWNLDAKYSLLTVVGFCGLLTISFFALETTNYGLQTILYGSANSTQ